MALGSEKDLRYCLLPGASPLAASRPQYEAAYRTWKLVWEATLKEVDGADRFFSDNFTRQTEVGALMLGGECVALSLFRFDDFSLVTAAQDSYFALWPKSCLKKLIKDGPHIIIASHLTVHPGYRGPLTSGVKLKDLIVQLCVKNLLSSGFDAMTGAMRCNRNANRAALDAHATLLQSAVLMHGLETDVVAWYSKSLADKALNLHPLTEKLWNTRIDFTHQGTSHLKVA